jgi:tRNA modification GTPase
MLKHPIDRLQAWLRRYQQSRIYFEGAVVVICGPPNVGKSSLFNRLIGMERNIVSPEPGTTRDFVEAETIIGGIRCKLIDTAGLGEAGSSIEQMGMDIARETIARADLVIEVRDATMPHDGQAGQNGMPVKHSNRIWVLNKDDLEADASYLQNELNGIRPIKTSALMNTGLEQLKMSIAEGLKGQSGTVPSAELILNQRQANEVEKAVLALNEAARQLSEDHQKLDTVSIELHSAISCLKRAQGLELDDDVIEQVFSKFCVGK